MLTIVVDGGPVESAFAFLSLVLDAAGGAGDEEGYGEGEEGLELHCADLGGCCLIDDKFQGEMFEIAGVMFVLEIGGQCLR